MGTVTQTSDRIRKERKPGKCEWLLHHTVQVAALFAASIPEAEKEVAGLHHHRLHDQLEVFIEN